MAPRKYDLLLKTAAVPEIDSDAIWYSLRIQCVERLTLFDLNLLDQICFLFFFYILEFKDSAAGDGTEPTAEIGICDVAPAQETCKGCLRRIRVAENQPSESPKQIRVRLLDCLHAILDGNILQLEKNARSSQN